MRCVGERFRGQRLHSAREQLGRLCESRASRRAAWSACLLVVAGAFGGAAVADELGEEQKPASVVSFHRDVQPIFARHCVGCHQEAKPQGEYVMTRFDRLLAGGESGEPAIVPGDPDASYLVGQITPVDGVAEMPKKAAALSAGDIDIIRRWIAEGAHDDSPAAPIAYSRDNPPVYTRPPAITSVDATAAGNLIAVAGFHEVILLDAESGATTARLIGMSERIESVRFSPDGTRLAAAAGDPGRSGEIQIWNVATGELELSKSFTFDTLRGVSWSPDGALVAFGGADNIVRAIDSTTGELKVFQGAHEDWVLGTAFIADGSHIVSVARDMTCKLTETATERFIDNITSITPGALRGGLSAVVPLPGRDEILVGGADGSAKVYRVFRASPRKIGDDANLLRTLPVMPGRIFAVDISDDTGVLAAVSTIDGASELCLWKAREQTEVSDEIMAILKKEGGQRSGEENEKLTAFMKPADEELARVPLDVAAYAACFLPNGDVAVGGADGQVRVLNQAGEQIRAFPVVAVEEAVAGQAAVYDPVGWQQGTAEREPVAAAAVPLAVDQVNALAVSPAEAVSLNGPFAYVQLLVRAEMTNGTTADATRAAAYEVTDNLAVSPSGLLRPLRDGAGTVSVTVGSQQVTLPVEVTGMAADAAVEIDFIRDVNPILAKAGCNQGTCHGAQKGKNGFKLSLRGYDPLFDIRALTDDLAARRVNVASPDDSLMLSKGLGRVPHEGGVRIEAGSPQHGILHRWIADGARLNMETPRVTGIVVEPQNPVVEAIGSTQQIRVVASYADGSSRDVTREAFMESGNTEVATSSPTGVLTAVRRGEAAVLVRYEGSYAATTLTVMGPRDGFEWTDVESYGRIDELVINKWQRMKIRPSVLCDDATFLRRVTLDLTGLPPSPQQVRDFLADGRPQRQKREEVIDRLLASPEYVDYWTNKWADLLQVNRKFLGAEGAVAFRDWIRQAVEENRPYDQFAREVLTSAGSNKANPAASYYKVLRDPQLMMENTTHLFLGVRFNCNQCHDHPFERWTQDQYFETAAFFAKTKLKKAEEAGDAKIGGTAVEGAKPLYEEVFDADAGSIEHPRTGRPVEPAFPYECDYEVAESATERERLAAWITSPDNRYFARSYVNRLWGYLLGVGLIEPIDDIRAGNPPTNPALLDHLTDEFVASGFDIRHVLREICTSRTYQLSVEANEWNADDTLNYSHAKPRRLPAEVLYDTIHRVTGATSEIPGVPAGTRAAALPDVGVATPDGFLANLGRPVRESACECERSSDLQLGPIMALVSGPTVGTAIASEGNELDELVQRVPGNASLVEELFVRILNRLPTAAEIDAFQISLEAIDEDHASLVAALAEQEQAWAVRKPQLEAEQSAAIAAAEQALAELTESLRPAREQAEKERAEKIAAAEAAVAEARGKLTEKLPAWEEMLAGSPEWFLLQPKTVSATGGNELMLRDDRSVWGGGSKEKGIYEVVVETRLPQITGFRLEALASPELPGGGPGLPPNGNFVLTEFEVFQSPLGEGEAIPLKIASGKASFTQEGFAIEQAFDGNPGDQKGWAVHPATGVQHWATFTLAEPVANPEGVRLTFKLHQQHNAEGHRLGAFRISATTAEGPLPLSVPEAFAAVLAAPAESRTEEAVAPVLTFLQKTDQGVRDLEKKVAEASAAIPVDPGITAIERQLAELRKPIQDDPFLIRLREDVAQSDLQQGNRRLTAAEDLTWALINSPAFLFNH